MPKLICIIQERSSSTRLPNKALLEINGIPVIDRICNRVKAVNLLKPGLIDEIVVAIPCGDKLAEHKFPEGIKLFEGALNNVLDRYYKCAREYKADWILRICGDCPLIDPFMVYGLLTKKPRKQYQALGFKKKSIPAGWDCELFSFEELERAFKAYNFDEHCSTYMRTKKDDKGDFGTDFDFKGLKYDLDTREDYERINTYYKLL